MKNSLLFFASLLFIASCQKETDENQVSPEISDQQFSIDENAVEGSVVDTVVAQDDVSYSILSGNIDNAFKIDSISGIITVYNSDAIDYETYDEFELGVKILDNSTSLSNTAIITITVNDIEIPTDGMVAYYKFNGNYNDLSSYSNNCTGYNTELLNTDSQTDNSMAAYLSGDDSYIKLPSAFDYQNRSISLWFNASDITGTQRLYYSDNPDLNYGLTNIDLSVDDSNGKPYIRMECGGGGDTNDLTTEIEENQWYHAVLTIDSDTVKAYLNGEMYAKTPLFYYQSSVDGNPYAYIGCNRNEDHYFFHGLIDNVVIYNSTLSDEQVEILYKE